MFCFQFGRILKDYCKVLVYSANTRNNGFLVNNAFIWKTGGIYDCKLLKNTVQYSI